ncbi:MAG: GAF domain-containing protein, partial [Anaerolineae bacterium]|nr:GAF domain-containing protein [Anaerolineae bacterium]
ARVIVENAPEAVIMIDMDTGLFIEPNENALQLYGLNKSEILKVGPADLSPEKQPDGSISKDLAVKKIQMALDGDTPVFEWTHLHAKGHEVFSEVRLVQLPDATRTLIRASIVDIAERKHNELIQIAISTISNAALDTSSLEELIKRIHQVVGTLMPADNFYIALYEEVQDLLNFPYYVDEHDTAWAPQKPGKGLTSYVLRTGIPLLATDKTLDALEATGEVAAGGSRGVDWLGVPLKVGDKPMGVMAIQSYNPEIRLTEQNRDTLAFIGSQVSSALENKQAELELRTLFSAMDDVIFVVDKDTRYLRIAPTKTDGLYYLPEELLGKRMDEIMPEKIALYFRESVQKALESNETIDIEYPLEIGGKEVWFDASLSKLGENQVYWVARDITERKESEKALADAHARVQFILDSATVPMHITSASDGVFLYANQAVSDTLRLPLDKILGSPASRFYYSEKELEEFNKRVQEHGSFVNIENRYVRGDGELFWGLSSTQTFKYEGQEAWLSTVIDITDIKNTENTLHRQNEYMAAAAEVGRLVTSTLDTSILFKRAVNLLREHFGYYHASIFTTEEAGAGLDVVVREATGEAGEEMKKNQHTLEIGSKSVVGTATDSGKPYIVNDVSKDPNHHVNPLLPKTKSEAAIPLKIGRRIIGALDLQATEIDAFTPEDIAVLELLADQFSTAIDNARSYKLAQDAFFEMRELEKLKSQFLANMSHELRTPLNSIIGFSRVILKGIDGPVTDLQQQDLTAIYNSGQHLLGLINDILDLSKIEAGKMELTFDEVDIEKLIKSVMSTVMGLVKDKPVRLESEIESDLPLVKADSMRVRQILINLFSNAAKFTDEGIIKVVAKANGSFVHIGVKDSGPGISAKDQEKLFQAFSQVDASATRATGGSGLGLSISKELVTMHNGEIGLNSEMCKGSEFYFTLPFFEAQKRIPETQNSKTPNNSPIILAIDDDEKVIDLYKRYLNAQGYQVVALTDPKKAVERAKELKPYAITLDIMMPNYDGWQVLEDLKSDSETQNFPTIICSIIEDTEKGYTLGATDYLLKPILDDDLVNALNRLNDSGEVYDILLIDDDYDDLRLLEKLLSESKIYKPTLANSGPIGWEKIQKKAPQAIILDLFMPEMDGFKIMDSMQKSTKLRNIPVIVISGGDLSATQQEKLDTLNLHLLQKGTLNSDDLLATLERSLNHLKKSEGKK